MRSVFWTTPSDTIWKKKLNWYSMPLQKNLSTTCQNYFPVTLMPFSDTHHFLCFMETHTLAAQHLSKDCPAEQSLNSPLLVSWVQQTWCWGPNFIVTDSVFKLLMSKQRPLKCAAPPPLIKQGQRSWGLSAPNTLTSLPSAADTWLISHIGKSGEIWKEELKGRGGADTLYIQE